MTWNEALFSLIRSEGASKLLTPTQFSRREPSGSPSPSAPRLESSAPSDSTSLISGTFSRMSSSSVRRAAHIAARAWFLAPEISTGPAQDRSTLHHVFTATDPCSHRSKTQHRAGCEWGEQCANPLAEPRKGLC